MENENTIITVQIPFQAFDTDNSNASTVSNFLEVSIAVVPVPEPADTVISVVSDATGHVLDQSSDGYITLEDVYQSVPAVIAGVASIPVAAIVGTAVAAYTGNPIAGSLVAYGITEAASAAGGAAGQAAYDYLVEDGYFEGPLNVTITNPDGSSTTMHHQSIGQGGDVFNGTTVMVHSEIQEFDENGNLISTQQVVTEVEEDHLGPGWHDSFIPPNATVVNEFVPDTTPAPNAGEINLTPTQATLNVLDSETNNGQPIVLDTADGSIFVQRYAPNGEMDTLDQIETQNGHLAITTVVNNPGGRIETVEISDI